MGSSGELSFVRPVPGAPAVRAPAEVPIGLRGQPVPQQLRGAVGCGFCLGETGTRWSRSADVFGKGPESVLGSAVTQSPRGPLHFGGLRGSPRQRTNG